MKLHFYKYQGTGNDFVIADNRKGQVTLTQEQVAFICDRRFGIGADGLMLLNEKEGFDFEMIYYNSDGRPGSMCGNGGRCLVKFAYDMGIEKDHYYFLAVDGPHEARIYDDGIVSLKMSDVKGLEQHPEYLVLDTGSPHVVQQVSEVWHHDVVGRGRHIRNSDAFREKGINVNFVEIEEAGRAIVVRTYERGVEDETYSCGTGVTAAAIAHAPYDEGAHSVKVKTKGGDLTVRFHKSGDAYINVWLEGPAVKVFEGNLEA